MRGYIRTIEDLEKIHYSDAGARFISKTDAPVLTTTTGVYNAIYGAQAWAMLNLESNAFGVMPKVPWTRSGWRLITARASSSVTGGVAENGAVPDSIMPTWAEVSTKPKTVAHVFNVSEIQNELAKNAGDDLVGDMAFMRNYMIQEHKEHINRMLLGDAGTVAGNNIESIDRVVSSKSEEDALLDPGDADIYGIDRSAATTYDAYVSHATGVDRSLTDTLIRTLRQNVLTRGAQPTFWFTGYDTYSTMQGIYDQQVQYNLLQAAKVKVGVNGVESFDGVGAGIDVSTLYGYPILTSKNVVQDTISRLYLLDTSNPEGFDIPRLCMRILKPTQYFEAGMTKGDPFGINKLADEGMFRMIGEIICSRLDVQGKLRDLKS